MLSFFAPCALVAALALPGDRITGLPFATRSEVIAQHGMVATSQPLATQAGLEVLRAGGNAIDAAIAANAVLALVEPTGCGLGGDLFAIVWSAQDRCLYGLNASGRSPRALELSHFQDLGLTHIPSHGPLPVTVPGCVDGWFELHARFGHAPMAALLQPAIDYAQDGFPLSELVAHYWERSVRALSAHPGFREQFTVGGRAPRKGEVFRNPHFASTLRALARGGRDAFYRGELAHALDAYMRRNGGFLRLADLEEHRSEWVQPLSTSYRGVELWELPPNTQGITALQILNVLEGYDLRELGPHSPEYVHLFVEAKKLAFEDRARLIADPDFGALPVAELVSKGYADARRALIDRERAALRLDAGLQALREGDTVYLATADRHGNMVSLIQSNYRGMGSGMAPDGLGYVLQDRGEMFDLRPGLPNSYAPAKRPFHTIIPAFATRGGKPWIAFGVMGGAVQPQMHAQVLINLVDFDMNLQEAGDAPRFLHEGSSEPTGEPLAPDGGRVFLESGYSAELRAELERRGHALGGRNEGYGGYQAIRFDAEQRVYYGASESRKDGQAAGY